MNETVTSFLLHKKAIAVLSVLNKLNYYFRDRNYFP
jgi:hypothetical protein